MDNVGERHGSDGKQQKGFWVRLLIVKSFISRLVNLFSLTEQDLMDAGVNLRKKHR